VAETGSASSPKLAYLSDCPSVVAPVECPNSAPALSEWNQWVLFQEPRCDPAPWTAESARGRWVGDLKGQRATTYRPGPLCLFPAGGMLSAGVAHMLATDVILIRAAAPPGAAFRHENQCGEWSWLRHRRPRASRWTGHHSAVNWEIRCFICEARPLLILTFGIMSSRRRPAHRFPK